MYDANPRTHLQRVLTALRSDSRLSYQQLRYVALDLRLTLEATLLEELTASYHDFSPTFGEIWRFKTFTAEIKRQRPDYELRKRLTPIVSAAKKRIPDYQELDLELLEHIYRELGKHIHLVNRYNYDRASLDLASILRELLQTASAHFEKLLKYPRIGVDFHGQDKVFFDDVVSKMRTFEEFRQHIFDGKLRECTIKSPEHPQQGPSHN